MESLDYWRLCDELSIFQAALLVANEDPSSEYAHVEGWLIDQRPIGYEAAKTAFSNAALRADIEARIVPKFHIDINGNECGEIEGSIDIERTTISVFSLKQFLRKRGFDKGFFFPVLENQNPDYLSRENPFYANKLASAVQAWKAVTENPILLKGKTPKQALEKWLREHAGEYGLTKEDGSPNEQGIEEIAKVANWKPGGGVAKTPGTD